jgi:hypothetical protein
MRGRVKQTHARVPTIGRLRGAFRPVLGVNPSVETRGSPHKRDLPETLTSMPLR